MMDGIRSGPVGGYGNPQQASKDAALGIQPSPMKINPYPGQYAHALLKPGPPMAYGPRMEASPFKGRLSVPTARPHTPPGSSHTIHPPVLGGHQMVYSTPGGGRNDYGLVPQQSATYELTAPRGFRSPPGVSNTHHERRRLTLLPTTGEFGPPMHGHGQMFPHQLGAEMYRDNLGAYHPPPMGMSLLSGAGDSQHLDHGPYKRLRLSGDSKTDPSQPLKIDTRGKEPMYTPQVEAISPTPGDRDAEDSPSRSTKDELLQQISKVDRDIATAESSVLKLKRKQQELEESSSKGTEDKDIEAPKSRHRSLPQIIYSDNRKKASEAHGSLSKLGPVVEFPLYNQPQDMPVFHENHTKYSTFRPRLIEFLRRQKKEVEEWQSKKMAAYTDRLSLWMKRVDRIERGLSPPPYDPNPPVVPGGITFAIPVLPKKRERDQRNRETFEKVFPELRKQREDKERLSRAGSRVKSDADLEEIMDGLQEQENEDKKMRSLAVVPPLMLDSRQRRLYYDNRNGIVEDPMDDHRERQLLNVWTEQEKEIFKEKYLQHPKGFVLIASFLERKSVADCVHYYYTSKKTENYKQLLRKSRARTRARTVQKAQQQQQDLSVGVTTRLQREALMKQGETSAISSTTVLVQGESVQISEVKGEGSEEKVIVKEEVEKVVTTVVVQEATSAEEAAAPRLPESETTLPITSTAENVSVTVSQVAEIVVQVKEEPQTPQSTHEEESVKTTTTVTTTNKEVVVTCAVCQSTVPLSSSRSLLTKDASMFGMKEADIVEGSRVCVTCRCNGVRRRLVNCPIPTCSTPKRRVKRLRPLPSKWLEMPMESKSQLISELQIPPDITRCCAACVNRISRRVGLFDSGSDVSEPSRRDSEVDESEGSSTSSNEEDVPDDRLQINEAPEAVTESRTKVPEIPRIEVSEIKVEPIVVIEPQPPPPLKDDYDSSETISADECQGALDIDEASAPQFAGDNGVRRTFTPPVSSGQHHLQVIPGQGGQGRPSRPPSTNKESITIKELMHGVIERSIKRKDPAPSPTARLSGALGEIPTITSILKDNQGYINQRPEVRTPLVSDQHRIASPHYPPPGVEWNQHPPVHHQRELYAREQTQREMYIQSREDKRVHLDTRKPVFPSPGPQRESVPLMVPDQHVKDEEQNETLDLSIKRDRESSPARAPVTQKSVNVPLRPSPGAGFVRQQAPFPREHEAVYEKAHAYSGGSITQGTPVNVDKSRKVVTTSVKDVPLQTVLFDHRTGQHVYLDRDRFLVTPQPREQQRKPSPSRSVAEQKSNVLLYSDYMLSQQMIRKERELPRHNSPLSAEHATYLAGAVQPPFLQSQERKVEQYPPGYAPNHYPSKPVHHRQGVIQHTPVGSVRYPQPQITKPGASQPMQLDFFADVVASQPSLPVPDKKDKDRPSPLPNPLPAHRGKSSNGELEKERLWAHHELQRGHDEKPHGLSADSLIDQIVHQQMGSSGVPRGEKAEMERIFPRYAKDSKIPEGYRPGVHEVASKPITLREHIGSIISEDFARPGYEGEPPFAAFIPNAWRERDPRHSVPHHPEKEHRPEVKTSHMAGLRAPAPVPRNSPSEIPGGSRPQMQERHPPIPDRHHPMPDRHAQIADRHAVMSDRHPHLPDRHPQSMERHHQMSERSAQLDRHMLERHGQMPDRHMLERHSLQERHQQMSERHPPQAVERHQQVMMRPATPQSHYLQRERMVQDQLKESWQAQRRMEKSSPQVFDYVKNKIAEVMRTEDAPSDHQEKADSRPGPAPSPSKRPRLEEDKSRQSPFQRADPNFGQKSRPSPSAQNPPSPYQQMPNYGYPYGVMTVRNPNPSQSPSTAHRSQPPSPAPAPPVSAHVTMPSSATPTAPSPHSRQVHGGGAPSGKEPAPLLSAQYEPLSDED